MTIKKRHNYKNLKIWSLGIEIVDDVLKLPMNFQMMKNLD